jgi:hypothetical protein
VINTASFVAVMGAATSQISYTAARAACSRCRVSWASSSPPRRARQRAVSGPGRYAAAARAVREGSREGRAPPCPRPDGPLRPRRGDRGRRAVPGQR